MPVTPDSPIREPEQIRLAVSRKVRAVQVSDQFTAILACLVGEKSWTTPELAELVATPDGMLLGRCEREPEFRGFLGSVDDLLRNIHGLAPVAELDGDEVGYLVARLAEIKRRR
jgi:hypothetical protein